MSCVDLTSYQEKLRMMIDHHKLNVMKRGMTLKFSSNKFARYLLNDTQKYMFNINVTDPDPIFDNNIAKHLLSIRKELTDPIYSILYSLVENIYLQDRIRFRIEDFLFTFDIYRKYLNQKLLTMKDLVFLQEYIFKDPFYNSPTIKPVHPAFFVYFNNICEKPVITKLWNGLVSFADILVKNIDSLSSSQNNNGISVTSIVPIVCSIVHHFYIQEEPTQFYNFITSLLIGKRQHFQPSITYYTKSLEDEFKKYLPLDDYDALFIVNLFGISQQVQRNIDMTRFRYFTFLNMRPQDIPYPSSLSTRINKHVNVSLEKNKKNKKSIKDLKEIVEKKNKKVVIVEEEKEEEEDDLGEMMKELGLEDDEEEEETPEEYNDDEDFD